MKKYKFLPILLIIFSIFKMQLAHGTIRYVNVNALGLNNGTSWTNAFTSLQSALNTANVDTIWVANGVYKPTNTTNRAISFVISGNKAVFGGFSGNETLLSERNLSNYQTVLSGDIGVVGDSTDNSLHVVKFSSLVKVLDGFKVCDGNADSAFIPNFPTGGILGGGINIYEGNLTLNYYHIKNCLFTNNYAIYGGAIGLNSNRLIVENCNFLNNKSQLQGGAISVNGASMGATLNVNNSNFYDNRSYEGGAIYNYAITFSNNCVFSGNIASTGGAIYNMGASSFSVYAQIQNSLIVGNTATNSSALYSSSGLLSGINGFKIYNTTIAQNKAFDQSGICIMSTPQSILRNSIVWGNSNINNSITINQIGGQITLTNLHNNTIENTTLNNNFNFNPIFISPGNSLNAPFNAANFNYRLDSLLSPAIDTGNNADVSVTSADLDGNPRVQNLKVDLGAYERYHCMVANAGAITANGPTSFCPGSTVTLTAPIGGFNYLWNTGSIANNITVSSSGNFTVSIVDGSNCVSHLQQQVSVKPSAAVSISGNDSFCENGQTTLTASGNNGGFTFIWSDGTTTASNAVNIPGPYFVVGTNSYGCSDTSDTVHVQSIPLPTINISGDTFFCENSSTILTVTGNATNYFWNNGSVGTNTVVDTPGAYYVNAINDFGCMANSDTLHVVSIPLPVPTITHLGDTLMTGIFNSYQWIKDNSSITGATNQYYLPNADGIYMVEVTNNEGCVGLSEPFNYTLLSIADINDKGIKLHLYPNPAKNRLVVDMLDLSDEAKSFVIYDVAGRSILKHDVKTKGTFEIELSGLANGTYILQLTTTNNRQNVKFRVDR